MITLYNMTGVPVVYADEDCRALYDVQGNIVAWFAQEHLYSLNGRYLGWAHQGWIYDRDGHPALFAENAIGGPERPSLHNKARALPNRIRLAPLPATLPRRQPRPARRHRAASWSRRSGLEYFSQ
ncbi:hypothetical protein SAMN06265337_3120 [Hymenobacter gelipurpurascens]|uniref:4-fold beta flower domain-containing protein n=2 Tax=Hymenobacter gelipurpurascens TaxID=89968 RepID=A0A212UCV2_9BACT|nr:hypothetical protein SAMN06265337_3120 [Hymenobacter gelipurpurascens]